MRVLSCVSFAVLLGLGACAQASRARYTGKVRQPVVEAQSILIHSSSALPLGHEALGVVTLTCETYDGASGLAEAPCEEERLLFEAREEAATRGGTLLVEPRCEHRVVEQTIEQVKGGGAKAHVRKRLSCRATVARGETTTETPRLEAKTETPPQAGAEDVTVLRGVRLSLRVERTEGAPHLPRVSAENIAETSSAPAGTIRIGKVAAACAEACSSSLARRGLKLAAGKLGARYLVSVVCDVIADRWRCVGEAYSPPPS